MCVNMFKVSIKIACEYCSGILMESRMIICLQNYTWKLHYSYHSLFIYFVRTIWLM